MKSYRKKPVVIQAILCSEAIDLFSTNWKGLPDWLSSAYENGGVIITNKGIHLPTSEGSMLALPTDMIICGIKNELYPCKPDIFEATYDMVPNE